MAQLKMYRMMDRPIEEPALPEGYSYGAFDPEKDIHAWCECLRGGNLIEGRTDEEAYRDEIINFKDIDPARDIQFLDYNGEHIGTATCFTWSHNGHGDMHQVGIRKDFRGRGLAKYLSYIILKKTKERGVKILELTTGEGRPAAVRSYLAAGFQPVEYDYRMQERWEVFMRDWTIGSLDMLYEDGTPYKTIYAHKTDRKIRFGVMGAGRGKTMMNYCLNAGNAELVAVCDKNETFLRERTAEFGDGVALYTDFDEFIIDLSINCAVFCKIFRKRCNKFLFKFNYLLIFQIRSNPNFGIRFAVNNNGPDFTVPLFNSFISLLFECDFRDNFVRIDFTRFFLEFVEKLLCEFDIFAEFYRLKRFVLVIDDRDFIGIKVNKSLDIAVWRSVDDFHHAVGNNRVLFSNNTVHIDFFACFPNISRQKRRTNEKRKHKQKFFHISPHKKIKNRYSVVTFFFFSIPLRIFILG